MRDWSWSPEILFMWFINNGIKQKLQMTQLSTNDTEFNRLPIYHYLTVSFTLGSGETKKKVRKRHYWYFASEHNAFDKKFEKYIIAKVHYYPKTSK